MRVDVNWVLQEVNFRDYLIFCLGSCILIRGQWWYSSLMLVYLLRLDKHIEPMNACVNSVLKRSFWWWRRVLSTLKHLHKYLNKEDFNFSSCKCSSVEALPEVLFPRFQLFLTTFIIFPPFCPPFKSTTVPSPGPAAHKDPKEEEITPAVLAACRRPLAWPWLTGNIRVGRKHSNEALIRRLREAHLPHSPRRTRGQIVFM